MAVIAACSSEETTNFSSEGNGFKQKSLATLTAQYNKMINSPSYKNEHAALNQFVTKMNFNGNPAAIQGDTETDMLLWISNNLSTTSFTSYSAAVNEWENVVALGVVSYQANLGFYNELGNNPGLYPSIIPPLTAPVSPNSCPDCKTAFNNCSSAANKSYGNAVEGIIDQIENNTITANQGVRKLEKADLKLTTALNSCKRAFLLCCGS